MLSLSQIDMENILKQCLRSDELEIVETYKGSKLVAVWPITSPSPFESAADQAQEICKQIGKLVGNQALAEEAELHRKELAKLEYKIAELKQEIVDQKNLCRIIASKM